MASKYWLKLYHEILDDPKMGRLRPATKWRFVECLLVAGERDDGGFLPDTDELAWRVRADAEQIETDLLELVKAGIIQKVDDQWFIPKFAERQAAVGVNERVARFRDRQKKQEYYDTETVEQRNGNDIVTKGYTDKIRLDKDIDKTPSPNGDTPTSIRDYEHDPAETPSADYYERRNEMVSAMAEVVRETFAIGETEERFNNAADSFMKQGITPDDIVAFPVWWNSQNDKPYTGRPWLKSLVQNIREVKQTERREYGHDAIPVSQLHTTD